MPEPDPNRRLAAKIKDIEAQIAALRSAASLRSATISDGDGLTTLDASGKAVVHLGPSLYADPSQPGGEVRAGDIWVPFTTAVSNGTSSTLSGTVQLNADAKGDTGWMPGPSVAIRTYSGAIDVTVGAALEVAGNKAGVFFGYQVLQAGQVVMAPDIYKAVACRYNGAGMGNTQQASTLLSERLQPGFYTVIGMHRLISGANENSAGSVTNRTLSVKGY